MTAAGGARNRPIFMVGMGRSGSTLLFECLATHPHVGWLAHHANRYPKLRFLYAANRLCDLSFWFRKSIERSDQRRQLLEKLRLGPAEAYETWESLCGEKIRNDWLLGARATPEECSAANLLVADVLRWSGKRRFAAKFTGPPRIEYLASLFPGARFLHVVRDGRAVAQSLLRVAFWRDTFRMRSPAWRNGFPSEWERLCLASSNPPLALAALQWRRVIEVARLERRSIAPDCYHEVRYEELLADPHATVDRLLEIVGLDPAPRIHDFLRTRYEIRDMNTSRKQPTSRADDLLLDALLAPALAELGYDSPRLPTSLR